MRFIRGFIFVLLWTLFFTLCVKINAQEDPIPDPPVPCDEFSPNYPLMPGGGYDITKPIRLQDEFHSLRPYQASATCQTKLAPLAKFCGNQLTFHDTIEVRYPGKGSCVENSDRVVCTYNETVNKSLAINLSDANLPFMGNTEEVFNSQNPITYDKDENSKRNISPEERVNNYVSWYLNGIFGRAEYSFPPVKSGDDIPSIPDFSGPINKLLPQEVQQQKRAQAVANAKDTRHDQIVGCTFGFNILGITELGGVPIPCYVDNSLLKPFINPKRLSDWKNHLPPVRSDPRFHNYTEYYIAYQEWRGKMCFEKRIPNSIFGIPVPIIGGKTILLCGENPFSPNYYSNLYPYIPLSSTEDLKGSIKVDEVSSATNPATTGVNVSGVEFNNQTPSTLFFPHMKEANELTGILQDTYISKSEQGNKAAEPTNVSTSAVCNSVEVRSNKGDSLFATQLSGTLHYHAAFSCNFKTRTQQIRDGDCVVIPPNLLAICPPQYCTKDTYISLSTSGSIPMADKVWNQTVAGPQSIFKRIFPKTNIPGGIGQIIDIPGSTNITYALEGLDQQNADLKFPHIGGISEYFLKGIQTLLRPKGYGEPISFGSSPESTSSPNPISSDICSGDCNSDPTNVNLTGVKDSFIDKAKRWFQIQGLGVGNPMIDQYEHVVQSSINAGVDPIFTLANWLNESGASNYTGECQVLGHNNPKSDYCQRVRDFGVNDPAIITQFKYGSGGAVVSEPHFEDQLRAFLNLPRAYISYCGIMNKCNMETFGSMYAIGECKASFAGNAHMVSNKQIYGWLAPHQKYPCYPVKLP